MTKLDATGIASSAGTGKVALETASPPNTLGGRKRARVEQPNVKMERIVYRNSLLGGIPEAKFQTADGWWYCSARIERGKPWVEIRGGSRSPSEAALVQVAIGMALDWIAEETAK